MMKKMINNMKKTLYSRATNGKTLEWTIEVESNKYRTISGYTDGVKTVSQWTLCEGKNIGRSNETTPEGQALSEALAIHRKKMEKGAFENISDIDTPLYFEPMLANKWEDYKSKIKYPVYSQPKLDGIRCIVKKDGMWTRNGKPIVAAPHIFEALKPLLDINPDLIFDGELYADKFANDFNAICSLVKKTKPNANDILESKEKIQYHVYDLPSRNSIYLDRYHTLYKMLTNYHPSIILVQTDQLDNEHDVEGYYYDYVSAGYEGQMIRLNTLYENKRSKSLLKHKSFIDEEYTIIDIEEGNGNKAGMVGAFVFKNKDGKIFNASPKFNWEVCQQMLKDKDSLIGKEATIKYFNLTPDNVPRFPYVIAIRDYE
jgi:DNA ligase-1